MWLHGTDWLISHLLQQVTSCYNSKKNKESQANEVLIVTLKITCHLQKKNDFLMQALTNTIKAMYYY